MRGHAPFVDTPVDILLNKEHDSFKHPFGNAALGFFASTLCYDPCTHKVP